MPYFVFHSKVVFYNFFSIFFKWCRQHWMLYYAAADKNHWRVLCRKISTSETVAMQEKFWQEQCTWQKDNSTFGGQISGDRKCGKFPQRPQCSTLLSHNSSEYTEFAGTPWGISQKINTPSLRRNWRGKGELIWIQFSTNKMELQPIVLTDLWNFLACIFLVIDSFRIAPTSLGHPTPLAWTHMTSSSGSTSRKGSMTTIPRP